MPAVRQNLLWIVLAGGGAGTLLQQVSTPGQTGPATPEVTAAYHEWYENHLREIAGTEGAPARFFAVV